MRINIERSPEMVKLVYFLEKYKIAGPNRKAYPPSEFGNLTWNEVHEKFYSKLGDGRPFKTFMGSANGLRAPNREGNIKSFIDDGVALLPKYKEILRDWAKLPREMQWADLRKYYSGE